jgi:hypothetical protein
MLQDRNRDGTAQQTHSQTVCIHWGVCRTNHSPTTVVATAGVIACVCAVVIPAPGVVSRVASISAPAGNVWYKTCQNHCSSKLHVTMHNKPLNDRRLWCRTIDALFFFTTWVYCRHHSVSAAPSEDNSSSKSRQTHPPYPLLS